MQPAPNELLSCQRVFLGWNAPILHLAARRLLAQPTLLGSTAVCVPGARSGRRLLEILVDPPDHEQRDQELLPPRFQTPRQLVEVLLHPLPEGRLATELESRLMWKDALEAVEPDTITVLFPEGLDGDNFARFEAGVRLAKLRAELGGENLRMQDVVSETEPDRWHALAEIERQFELRLERSGLADLTSATQRCLTSLPLDLDPLRALPFARVILGLAEVGTRLRSLLHHRGIAVESWIAAPEPLADLFDGCGAVRPNAWSGRRIPISDRRLHFTHDPRDLARNVVERLQQKRASVRTAASAKLSPDTITIGLADPGLVGVVERALSERGLPTHDSRGHPFALSRTAELLRRMSAYARGRSFEDFATLVRHPDLAPWIERESERGIESFLAELDRLQNDRLPSTWPPPAPLTAPWPWAVDLAERTAILNETRPLAAWSEPLADLLRFAYGQRSLDRRRTEDAQLIEALSSCRSELESWLDLDSTDWRGTEAVRLLLQSLETTLLADPERGPAVELVGWLELPLDDAETLFVAGLDEGSVPGTPSRDVFLPDRLRRELGLNDRQRRYARDAYAFSVIEHAHDHVEWFLARRALDNTPLLPSRLLLADQPRTVARRWLRFSQPDAKTEAAEAATAEAHLPPAPRPEAPALTRLRVTGFRDYLGCPYRFYLRHVERLRPLDDQVHELDGAAFGSFVHEVLHRFGETPEVASTTEETRLRRFLDSELSRVARERWGQRPLATVRIQIELARERLHAFASWQVQHVADGWRIASVELDAKRVPWAVDDLPFDLSGRIDRIDRHRETGEVLIIDYKTSDRAQSPEETHRKRQGTWIDLQLPLYRHLAIALDPSYELQQLELAYVLLARRARGATLQRADWDTADLESADECARDVIRKIRQRLYWPPAEPPPPFSEVYSAIVQDGRLIAGSDEVLLDVPTPDEGRS